MQVSVVVVTSQDWAAARAEATASTSIRSAHLREACKTSAERYDLDSVTPQPL